jgi:Fe2+ or Zn2+ uptake regulation protein
MRTPAELTQLFRARGLKVTPQRQCVFRLLDGARAHPSAEAIYDQARAEMPTISLRTVYQTLNDLAEMGEIQSLDLGTGATRFDPNTTAHHHLVCTSCGQVRDVYVDLGDVHIPPAQRRGFQISSTDVVFRGLCDACSTRSTTATSTTHNHTEG